MDAGWVNPQVVLGSIVLYWVGLGPIFYLPVVGLL